MEDPCEVLFTGSTIAFVPLLEDAIADLLDPRVAARHLPAEQPERPLQRATTRRSTGPNGVAAARTMA